MQRAARKVALENRRLRNLLASHGVTQQEVNSYLQSFDDAAIQSENSASPPQKVGQLEVKQNSVRTAITLASCNANSCQDSVSREGHVNPHVTNVHNEDITSHYHRPTLITETQLSPPKTRSDHNAHHFIGRAISGSVNPATMNDTASLESTARTNRLTTNDHSSDSGTHISCETAAAIIADMSGNTERNRDDIRVSLGCSGYEDCRVKNSTVMQVMDEG